MSKWRIAKYITWGLGVPGLIYNFPTWERVGGDFHAIGYTIFGLILFTVIFTRLEEKDGI